MDRLNACQMKLQPKNDTNYTLFGGSSSYYQYPKQNDYPQTKELEHSLEQAFTAGSLTLGKRSEISSPIAKVHGI